MQAQTVTIVGLGRVGASIGLAIRQGERGLTVIGNDRDRSAGQKATEIGAVDKTVGNLVSAASVADILILATAVDELEDVLRAIGEDVQSHTLVLDLASLKGVGLSLAGKYLKNGHYVGVSPVLAATVLADARSGIEAAASDLFRQSVFCIMPAPDADPKAVETAVNLGRILGAVPFFLDAQEYDSLIHGVETMPGLLAAALFHTVARSEAWRDMLRFAGLPFAQATSPLTHEDLLPLALHNKAASLRWLDGVAESLAEVRSWLAQDDEDILDSNLRTLVVERERWIREREENDWSEAATPEDLSGLSVTGQMLGFRGRSFPGKSKTKKS